MLSSRSNEYPLVPTVSPPILSPTEIISPLTQFAERASLADVVGDGFVLFQPAAIPLVGRWRSGIITDPVQFYIAETGLSADLRPKIVVVGQKIFSNLGPYSNRLYACPASSWEDLSLFLSMIEARSSGRFIWRTIRQCLPATDCSSTPLIDSEKTVLVYLFGIDGVDKLFHFIPETLGSRTTLRLVEREPLPETVNFATRMDNGFIEK